VESSVGRLTCALRPRESIRASSRQVLGAVVVHYCSRRRCFTIAVATSTTAPRLAAPSARYSTYATRAVDIRSRNRLRSSAARLVPIPFLLVNLRPDLIPRRRLTLRRSEGGFPTRQILDKDLFPSPRNATLIFFSLSYLHYSNVARHARMNFWSHIYYSACIFRSFPLSLYP
jgi:hypothetical protein